MVAATDIGFVNDITFEIEGFTQPLHVLRVDGSEGMSELFRFDITVVAEGSATLMKGLIGAAATLSLAGEHEPRAVQGIVSRIRQGAGSSKHVVYNVTIVPKMFRLVHRFDHRIFQELTTIEIVQKVLEGAGFSSGDDFRIAVQGSYPTREYCVQYGESDWAFICRLMEDDGVFTFFEGGGNGARLVLADAPSAHAPIDGKSSLPFRPGTGALRGMDAISTLERVDELHAGKVTLRDYTFQKPSLLLESVSEADGFADLEVYAYPGGYEAPGVGSQLARLRTEERKAAATTVVGTSGCPRLTPGATITIEDHPVDDMNVELVVTAIRHSASRTDGEAPYEASFTAVPKTVPYRPLRLTPRPTIRVQTAVVVGPSGEEIYTDEHGRVKVQFHWDRLGKKDDKSSCFIRVSQSWAGTAFGGMQLPRIGQEVIVDFLDGDPDRPIIVGRVYHGTNTPPYPLPDNKTMSTLLSRSSPSGDAGNELRFEDKKSSEEVYLHAEKDWNTVVENDRTTKIKHDSTLEVTNDQTIKIGNNRTDEVTGNVTTKITGDETAETTGTRTITVTGDATDTLEANQSITVGKNFTLEITGDASEAVTGKKTIEVKGDKLEITCGPSKVTISQSKVEIETPEVKIKGTSKTTVESAAKVEVKAPMIEAKADGMVKVEASGMVQVEASGMVKIKGAVVQVN